MLNRRSLMGWLAASSVLPAVALANDDRRWTRMAPASRGLTIHITALGNPHLDMVLDWIKEVRTEGELYVTGDHRLWDTYVKLDDPIFEVRGDRKVNASSKGAPGRVWSYAKGYTDEPGLAIIIRSRGVVVTTAQVCSKHGLIFSEPGYQVGVPHLPWDREEVLKVAGLTVRHDMSWLEKHAAQAKASA